MKIIKQNQIVTSFLLFLFSFPLFSMDISQTPSREEVLEKTIVLLRNNGQVFETAFKLSMDSARTLLNKTKTPITKELIEEAKRWVGSAVDFGRDHGWPLKIRQNEQFLALYFIRAAGYWLSFYSSTRFCEMLLTHNPDDSAVSAIHDIFNEFISKKIPENQHEVQTEAEIEAFGEYPAIDYQGLMYGPWSDILALLTPIRPTSAPNNPILEKMTSEFDKAIMQLDKQLVQASYYLIINEEIAVNDFDPDLGYGEDYKSAAMLFFRIMKDKDRRFKIAENRLDEAYKNFESFIAKLPIIFDVNSYLPKDSWTSEYTQNKRQTKNTRIRKNKENSPIKSSFQENLPVIQKSQVVKVKTPIKEEKVFQSEILSKQDEKEIVDTVESEIYTPTHLQYQNKKKSAEVKSKITSKISPYAYNEYLPQEVVEVFLDIFGNLNGDIRCKNQKSFIYNTQGWGTIKSLLEKLEYAGWLVNQKETTNGIKKEKHRSSTISFRMPNSQKNITTIILKFHNDHTVGERMREITRHFIVKNLEYFGFTESFLLTYYKENFCKEG